MNTHPDLPWIELPALPSLDGDLDPFFEKLHPLVSDIFIQPDMPIMVRYGQGLYRVSDSVMPLKGMGDLADSMVPSTVADEIKQGHPQVWSHRITTGSSEGDLARLGGGEILRFRCAGKSVQSLRNFENYQFTMRPNPTNPVALEKLNLPPGLVRGLFPESGMVLFSGPTGSGKTTTLAAVMRELMYDERGKVIVTVEDPVEYNLHALEDTTAVLTHCELGRNVDSFPEAMRAALRENPDVIMTGEMRDEASMLVGVEASQTGHGVYSTLHTDSVTGIFVRVANKMPPDRVGPILASFIQASRTFVYQRLFPSAKGGVVPIIEYICLDGAARIRLLDALKSGGVAEVTRVMSDLMDECGQWYTDSATAAYERGELESELYEQIVRTYQLQARAETSTGG